MKIEDLEKTAPMTQEFADRITYSIVQGIFDEHELSYMFKNRGESSKIASAAFIDKTLWDIVELTVIIGSRDKLEEYMAEESHDVLMAWQNRGVLFSLREGMRTMKELVDFLNELKEKHMILDDGSGINAGGAGEVGATGWQGPPEELKLLLEKHGIEKHDVWAVFGEGRPMYCIRFWDNGIRFYADAETPEMLVQKVKDFIAGN